MLNFIPETVWKKIEESKREQKRQWLECHYDVVVFCEYEGLDLYKKPEPPPKSNNKPKVRRVDFKEN